MACSATVVGDTRELPDVRERIAVTGTRVPDLFRVSASTTPDRLTPDDVRAAVGMLRRSNRAADRWPLYGDLLLVAYADNPIPLSGIVRHYALWMEQIAEREEWKSTEHIRRMVACALDEAMHAPKCRACEGRGWKFAGRGKLHRVDCDSCEASGHRPHSGRLRAREVGIHHENFRKWWAPRYRRALVRIQGDLKDATAAMRRVLR